MSNITSNKERGPWDPMGPDDTQRTERIPQFDYESVLEMFPDSKEGQRWNNLLFAGLPIVVGGRVRDRQALFDFYRKFKTKEDFMNFFEEEVIPCLRVRAGASLEETKLEYRKTADNFVAVMFKE